MYVYTKTPDYKMKCTWEPKLEDTPSDIQKKALNWGVDILVTFRARRCLMPWQQAGYVIPPFSPHSTEHNVINMDLVNSALK